MLKIRENNFWVHYFLLFFGILCISWSAILVKIAGINGFASGFYRMFFGSVGIIPIWFLFHKPIADKRGLKIAIICGILFACDIALWNTSIMNSKASISTLLANLAPVWVGLGALLFMKEKPGKIFWIGTLIAMTGVSIIIGYKEVMHANLNFGNMLAIFASVFYGAYILIVRKGRINLDTFTFTTVSMISSTIVLGVLCFITNTPLSGYSSTTWYTLLILGLIPQLIGWLSINQALGHIRPELASVSLLSQTVFTALFSIPILNEHLSIHEIGGAFIVLTGIYLVNKKKSKIRT